MSPLPKAFEFLKDPGTPAIVAEAVKMLGTTETPGAASNPTILKWADEIGDKDGSAYARWAAGWYDKDSIAWCGLFVAICAVRSNPNRLDNRRPPEKYLSALEWRKFGIGVDARDMIIGDVAVMERKGGGHVTIVIGMSKDRKSFYGIGGNQGDKVTIASFPMDRVAAKGSIRRIPYGVRPDGAKQILIAGGLTGGPVSEA
jgi:uncharacterized protein (TIGR02594 family)